MFGKPRQNVDKENKSPTESEMITQAKELAEGIKLLESLTGKIVKNFTYTVNHATDSVQVGACFETGETKCKCSCGEDEQNKTYDIQDDSSKHEDDGLGTNEFIRIRPYWKTNEFPCELKSATAKQGLAVYINNKNIESIRNVPTDIPEGSFVIQTKSGETFGSTGTAESVLKKFGYHLPD